MSNNMAPDLSGLDPFMYTFLAVAVIGAVVSLVIIGQSLTAFVVTNHRARVARRESIPTYYRRLVLSH
jgi:cell division protein FtsX